MATVVEISQPNLAKQTSQELPRDPEPLHLNTSATAQAKEESVSDSINQTNDKDAKNKKGDATKPKIFDNKTFVEAPIPKTNPWNKSTTVNPTQVVSNHAPEKAPRKPGEYIYFRPNLLIIIHGIIAMKTLLSLTLLINMTRNYSIHVISLYT